MAFLTDAFVHCKFIGWSPEASPLVEVCGLGGVEGDALVALTDPSLAAEFIAAAAALRHWPREERFISQAPSDRRPGTVQGAAVSARRSDVFERYAACVRPMIPPRAA